MIASTFKIINSKQWTELRQLQREARGKIVNQNRLDIHRAKNKEKARQKNSEVLALFDTMKKHIENRNIVLLDEAICDYVNDFIYEIDRQDSVFIQSIMAFYHTITGYRL